MVAKLWGEASHAVVEKALDALENLEHRGAEGADPNTGDGAGHPAPDPRRVLPRGRRRRAAGRPAATASASATCRATPSGSRRSSADRGDDRGRGPAADLVARRPGRRPPRRRHRAAVGAGHPPGGDRRLRGARRPGRVRAQAVRDPPADRARGRERPRAAELLLPDDRLQGDAHRARSCRATSPTCATRASPRGWRSCTRASRPTRSRAGSSPTRSG